MRATRALAQSSWSVVAGGREGAAALAADRTGEAPRVLIAACLDWFSNARLADAFAAAGCRVEAVCPRGHVLSGLRDVARAHALSMLSPYRSLVLAIKAARPDLVIPCDDVVAACLRDLQAAPRPEDRLRLQPVLRRSLGAVDAGSVLTSRSALIGLARGLGLRAPATWTAQEGADLAEWLARARLPVVVKSDGSWGGQGVVVAASAAVAQRAVARLSRPPSLARVAKRLLLDADATQLAPWLGRRRPIVSLQSFVPGRPANAAVACWRGEVLAMVCVEALRTDGDTGPATVVRTLDHPEIARTAEILVGRLGLSGLCGFDFILDPDGRAHLIEANPRASPTCHLALDDDHSLVRALARRLRGAGPTRRWRSHPPGRLIALFPAEMQRDPDSPFLDGRDHDVPWRSPELVAKGLAYCRRRSGLLSRLRRTK